ncbi:sensor histidine kinase [Chengkuizengella axinellae]|uniref:histidine kinase n=1 Tax=Chengkuizengella axinellae TaxID=3064388 RepID=A0ABT9IUN4_9BACL|nr:sensor histidine kinase [Chengkuizengella sp. 2205SS18-9]MDP5272998.1 sensor histidine kinase [Chengkuizengella sp. 2205SS18-9]
MWARVQKLTQISLRKKIIIAIITCLIVPSIIAIAVSNYLTRDAMLDLATETAQDSLDRADIYVNNYISSMVYVMNNIQFDPSISSIMKTLGQQSKDPALLVLEGQKITQKLQALTAAYQNMYITVLLPNDAYFTSYREFDFNPIELRSEPWFSDLDQLSIYDVHWVGFQKNYIESTRQESPYLITLAKVLKSGGKPYAYIILSVEEQSISDIFNGYSQIEKMILMDSQGIIISSIDDTEIGSQFEFFNESSKLLEIDNKEYLLLNKQISFADWSLSSLVSYQNTIERIQAIQRFNYLVQIIFVLIFIVLLFLIMNRIMKPLLGLERVASRFDLDNLHERVQIRGKDEIGRLGQVFNQLLDHIQNMIKQITEEQSRKREVEIELLQAQINPHFLFNLLNSIRMRILMNGDKESADIISSLSKLLRMTITRNNEFQSVPVEVEVARHYVKLMNVRHNHKIQYHEFVDPNVLMETLPRFTIQPFIENAFIHGLKQKHGDITLSIWKDQSFMYLSVKDNGMGMKEERLEDLHKSFQRGQDKSESQVNGIGLKNVYDRLRIIYDSSFSLDIYSDPESGTEIKVQIPLAKKGEV